jgi:hypothetical protein
MSLAEIAIVGTATSTIDKVPWRQRNTVFWTVNSLYKAYARFKLRIDLWFELHHDPSKPHPECLEWAEQLHPEWFEWAFETQPRVMMAEEHPKLVNSEVYPREKVEAEFGPYLTSSVAMMLGLAILQKPKSIGIYGVDLALGEEYYYQRPCVEYLIGRSMGAGIPVKIPEKSQLLKSSWTYGYDGPLENLQPKTVRDKERDELAVAQARLTAATKMIIQLQQERDAALRGHKKSKNKRKRRIR